MQTGTLTNLQSARAKEIQNKMFTPMFTTKSKGQGFGLPVVKRMTESLGGTVSFESQEGKGTTFTVRLTFKRGGGNWTFSEFAIGFKYKSIPVAALFRRAQGSKMASQFRHLHPKVGKAV